MVFEGGGICLKCVKPYTSYCGKNCNWCCICSVKYLQENLCSWSGNESIDKFIKEKQQNYEGFFEWIPYNKLKNIKAIRRKSISTIYSAEWEDGHLEFYNEKNHEIRRYGKLKVGCLDLG